MRVAKKLSKTVIGVKDRTVAAFRDNRRNRAAAQNAVELGIAANQEFTLTATIYGWYYYKREQD